MSLIYSSSPSSYQTFPVAEWFERSNRTWHAPRSIYFHVIIKDLTSSVQQLSRMPFCIIPTVLRLIVQVSVYCDQVRVKSDALFLTTHIWRTIQVNVENIYCRRDELHLLYSIQISSFFFILFYFFSFFLFLFHAYQLEQPSVLIDPSQTSHNAREDGSSSSHDHHVGRPHEVVSLDGPSVLTKHHVQPGAQTHDAWTRHLTVGTNGNQTKGLF